jgi:hypothetical protein
MSSHQEEESLIQNTQRDQKFQATTITLKQVP